MMLQSVMNEYFSQDDQSLLTETNSLIPVMNYSNDVPVKPKASDWVISEKEALREYSFKTRKQKESFIVEMIKYCRDSDCDIEMSIRGSKVKIIIYSLAPSLSNIEFECIQDIKKIRKDIMYYFASKN
jgi:hypothetical protein